MSELVPTGKDVLDGKLIDVARQSWLSDVEITLTAKRPDGELVTESTHTDADGMFSMVLPDGEFAAARLTANLIGFSPIDLTLDGNRLDAGEVTLFANESAPSKLWSDHD
jgi:hypothetical protein